MNQRHVNLIDVACGNGGTEGLCMTLRYRQLRCDGFLFLQAPNRPPVAYYVPSRSPELAYRIGIEFDGKRWVREKCYNGLKLMGIKPWRWFKLVTEVRAVWNKLGGIEYFSLICESTHRFDIQHPECEI